MQNSICLHTVGVKVHQFLLGRYLSNVRTVAHECNCQAQLLWVTGFFSTNKNQLSTITFLFTIFNKKILLFLDFCTFSAMSLLATGLMNWVPSSATFGCPLITPSAWYHNSQCSASQWTGSAQSRLQQSELF